VGHLPDQPPRSSARESGIAVERDHVADARGNHGRVAADLHERRVARAAKQSIQLMELPALAFPADPLALPVVPDPPAMEQEESVAIRCGSMASIQPRNRRGSRGEEILVSGRTLRVAVRPVREQSETKIVVGARQRVNFEPVGLLLDLRSRRQEGGHDEHRAQTRGHALAKLQAR
jgi:hypothetical protein